jgi:hypothetical protein
LARRRRRTTGTPSRRLPEHSPATARH